MPAKQRAVQRISVVVLIAWIDQIGIGDRDRDTLMVVGELDNDTFAMADVGTGRNLGYSFGSVLLVLCAAFLLFLYLIGRLTLVRGISA